MPDPTEVTVQEKVAAMNLVERQARYRELTKKVVELQILGQDELAELLVLGVCLRGAATGKTQVEGEL